MTPDTEELGGFERRLLAKLSVMDEQRPFVAPGTGGHRRSGRILAIAAAAVFVPALTAGAVAVFWGPDSIAVAGDTAVAGYPVGVKGVGCDPARDVTFTLDGDTPLGSMRPQPDGSFVADVPIPAGTNEGIHQLRVACPKPNGGDLVETAKLHVLATMPPMGPAFAAGGVSAPGGPAFFKGAGCAAGSVVNFVLEGVGPIGSVTADGSGLFNVQVTIPASTSIGEHTVTATCTGANGAALTQNSTLTVAEPSDPGPQPTK